MKQLVLMNKQTGEMCPAIRIQFFDSPLIDEGEIKFEGFSVNVRNSSDYDGYLIYSGNPENDKNHGSGPWLFVEKSHVELKTDCLGEL